MAYELQRLAASGETAYISKHNSNYTTIEAALNAIAGVVSSAAGGGAAATLPVALKALFGSTPAVIGSGSYKPTIAGLTLQVAAGFAWLPTAGVVVGSGVPAVLDLTPLADGAHYLTADGAGAPRLADTADDALWSVVKAGGVLSTLTRLAAIAWGQADWAGAQASAAHGAYETLDARLEAIEGSIPAAPDLSAYQAKSEKGAALGYAALGADGKVPAAQLPASATGDYVPTAAVGAAGGVASLDGTGKVPAAQIPAAAQPFLAPVWRSGKPAAGEVLLYIRPTVAVSFAAALAGTHVDVVEANPTATAVISVRKNGVEVGTISIANTGAVTLAAAAPIALNGTTDRLTLVAPAVQDATLAGVAITLHGTR